MRFAAAWLASPLPLATHHGGGGLQLQARGMPRLRLSLPRPTRLQETLGCWELQTRALTLVHPGRYAVNFKEQEKLHHRY